MKFRFIHAEKAVYPLGLLCRVMEVSTKGYYSWLERGEAANPGLTELDRAVRAVHKENKRRYGSRRIREALAGNGMQVGRTSVRSSMRRLGLKVRYPKAFRVTTQADPNATYAPNILNRQFYPTAPNQAWAGDIERHEAFSYRAEVKDLRGPSVAAVGHKPRAA